MLKSSFSFDKIFTSLYKKKIVYGVDKYLACENKEIKCNKYKKTMYKIINFNNVTE